MNKLSQSSMTTTASSDIDQGLRSYLLGVYNHMSLALVISGIVAWLTTSFVVAHMSSLLFVIGIIALPFVFLLILGSGLKSSMTYTTSFVLFTLFAASMGLSLSTIFAVYTAASIINVFFIASATFASASLYGYLTNRDLTKIGNIMIVGVIGIIIASVVNIFMASPALAFAISIIGVIAFVGLTAYDTQKLKEEYYSNGMVYGATSSAKSSIWGAITLYLDFLNLFMFLLQLLGSKKD